MIIILNKVIITSCLFFFICSSCINTNKQVISIKDIDSLKYDIVIVTNNSCAFEFTFNKSGQGKLFIGRSDSYWDSTFKFIDITQIIDLKIKHKQKLTELNQLLDRLENSKQIKGEHHSDAWRCIFNISREKKIDVYGTMEVKDLYDIIMILQSTKSTKIDVNKCNLK